MPSIAHYEILEKLGEGGMGAVYKARDTHLLRLVALKFLPSDKVADPERRKRFVQEARAASALNHPNIVTIHDVAVEAGVHFIVMEYVSGRTLSQAIGSRGLPVRELLPFAIQIADALAAAHASGIIHRDLKPANLMVTGQGTVKVLDFGLAKLTEGDVPGASAEAATASGLSPLSAEGTIVGTTDYLSPEQIEGRKLDARSDVFAFGVVLYEMATGRRAFRRDSTLSTLSAILRDEPPPATQIAPDLPRGLERVIVRCLKKNPGHRFQHIGDVKIALEELEEDLERDQLPSTQGTGRAARSRVATWIGVAAAVALGGAGAAIWLWQRTTDKAAPILSGVPLTTYPGFETYPTLSPDGNQVAFAWDGEQRNNFDIYVKLVGPGTPIRLTTDPAADTSPAWSPNGRWIAFIRVLPKDRAALILVPALGGPERRLGEIAVPSFIAMPDFGYALSWSPDSGSLIVTDKPSSKEPGGLFTWSVATGERRRLTSLPLSDWIDFGPALSLDGRWLAFTRVVSFGVSDLYVLPLAADLRPTGEPQRVTYQNRFTTSPAWTPNGSEIIVSSGSLTSGATSLFVVDGTGPKRPEGRLRRLDSIGDAGLVAVSHPSAGGPSRMVYTLPRADSGIRRIALPRKEGTAVTAAEAQSSPFAFSTRPDYLPQYSPDGQRVAFVSDRSGPSEIWTCDKDGANFVQVTVAAWPETATPRWSPDGSLIVFHARPKGSGDIFTVSAGGGTPTRVTDDAADEWGSSWSRDGRWIYFGSKRSGRFEVWKTLASGGTAVQVTTNGGLAPLESPDGQHVYYVKGLELWRIPVNGGNESRVLESLSDWSRFALTEGGIYFIPDPRPSLGKPVEYTIEFLRLSNRQIYAVARLEKPLFLGLTVSPDGHSLLYSQMDESGTDLMLVDNFR